MAAFKAKVDDQVSEQIPEPAPEEVQQPAPAPIAEKVEKLCAAARCGGSVVAYGLCEQHARSTTGQ